VIKEQKWCDVDGDRVREISNRWLETKACKKRELQCSTWPAIYDDEWCQRKFYVYEKEGGKMVAFIWWLPCFRDGKVVGYTANCLRKDSDKSLPCHNYVLNYAFLACVEIFKAEGNIEFAAMGPAYGADVQGEEGDSSTVRFMAKWAYKNLTRFYNLKGLADHKDLYKANRQSKLYACHKGPYSKLVYIIMPFIASDAIPHLSTGLFGKGVFAHKYNKDDALLLFQSSPLRQQEEAPVTVERISTTTTTPTTTTPTTTAPAPSPEAINAVVVVLVEEEQKKPKWQPKQRDGPKLTKRQRKRLEKQQKQQQQQAEEEEVVVEQSSSKEESASTTTTTTTHLEPTTPFQLIKAVTSSILHSLSHRKDSIIKGESEKSLKTTTTPSINKKMASHSNSQKTLSLDDEDSEEEQLHTQLADLVVLIQSHQ